MSVHSEINSTASLKVINKGRIRYFHNTHHIHNVHLISIMAFIVLWQGYPKRNLKSLFVKRANVGIFFNNCSEIQQFLLIFVTDAFVNLIEHILIERYSNLTLLLDAKRYVSTS